MHRWRWKFHRGTFSLHSFLSPRTDSREPTYIYLQFGTQELDTRRSEMRGRGRSLITLCRSVSWSGRVLVKADIKWLYLILLGSTIQPYIQWNLPQEFRRTWSQVDLLLLALFPHGPQFQMQSSRSTIVREIARNSHSY
jgi:hypothetical protein